MAKIYVQMLNKQAQRLITGIALDRLVDVLLHVMGQAVIAGRAKGLVRANRRLVRENAWMIFS
jgi:hypothetical protein